MHEHGWVEGIAVAKRNKVKQRTDEEAKLEQEFNSCKIASRADTGCRATTRTLYPPLRRGDEIARSPVLYLRSIYTVIPTFTHEVLRKLRVERKLRKFTRMLHACERTARTERNPSTS